ncbi:MAG: rod shape-determining protein MreD [Candidatus Margulisiibacteriota bacterium]
MQYFKLAVFSFVLMLAQSASFSRLDIFGARPDLILLLAVICGLMGGAEKGLAAGILLGFCQDMLYGTGYYFLFGLGFAGFVSGALKGEVISDDIVSLCAIAFISMFFYHLFYALIFQYIFARPVPGFRLSLLTGAAINAFLAPVFIEAYKKIFENG